MRTANALETNGLLDCIGNTPLVRLNRVFPRNLFRLYAKLEMFNPGGSLKDRTASQIVRHALTSGQISPGTTLIESTSGNMGVALACICHAENLKLILVTDPHINPLAEKILEVYGATVIKVDQHDGKGGYLNTRLKKVRDLLDEIPDSFWPDQYHNVNGPLAHRKTFEEIVGALNGAPDYLFAPVSTGGTLRGLTDAIKTCNARTKVIAVDAVGSVVFGGAPGLRLIPGMGASRRSVFLPHDELFDVVAVSDTESIEACRKLLKEESILGGGSSGAVLAAIEKKSMQIPPDACVVAIFPDDGERYLDTIYSDNWVNMHFGQSFG